MLIRFLKRWRTQKPGVIVEWPDGAANTLIKRGIAIEDESGYETGMIEQDYETRANPQRGRGKGKR